jgi:hypothetical protein
MNEITIQVRNHWTNKTVTMIVHRVTATMIICSNPLDSDPSYKYRFNRNTGSIGNGRSATYSMDPKTLATVVASV